MGTSSFGVRSSIIFICLCLSAASNMPPLSFYANGGTVPLCELNPLRGINPRAARMKSLRDEIPLRGAVEVIVNSEEVIDRLFFCLRFGRAKTSLAKRSILRTERCIPHTLWFITSREYIPIKVRNLIPSTARMQN